MGYVESFWTWVAVFISFIWQFGHFHVISYISRHVKQKEKKMRIERRNKKKIMLFLLNHIALVLINSIQFMKHCRRRDRKTKMLAFFAIFSNMKRWKDFMNIKVQTMGLIVSGRNEIIFFNFHIKKVCKGKILKIFTGCR